MGLLDGKVAIITGAGGGLGKSHALSFAKEGAKIVVNDLGGSRDGVGTGTSMADEVVAEIQELGGEAIAHYGSVSDAQAAAGMVKTALDTWGRLDILVNNAGILRDRTLLKLEDENFDIVLNVHARGTYLVTKHAAAAMKDLGNGGSIINTTSIAGLTGNFGQTNYACAKAGIWGMTMVWAKELSRAGIRVNGVGPMAKTRMTEDIAEVPDDITPEMISPVFLFLASDLAGDITGRTFGAHGDHVFEYHMQLSQGARTEEKIWTVQALADRIGEISRLSEPSSGGGDDDEGRNTEDMVEALFLSMPEGFKPEKAAGWTANLRFEVGDTGTYSLLIDNSKCRAIVGGEGTPTATVKIDCAATILGIAKGEIDAQQAFMSGKMSADNLGDLMKFSQTLSMRKAGEAAKRVLDGGSPGDSGELAEASAPPPSEAAPPLEGMNRALIGKTHRQGSEFVSREHTEAYARATNDLNPRYLEGDSVMASPFFAVRPVMQAIGAAVMDEALNCNIMRLLHGEQDMRFHAPLYPKDLICTRSTIHSIEEKSSGELLEIKQRIMRDGEAICEIISGYFVRGKSKAEKSKSEPSAQAQPEHRDLLFECSYTVDADQSLRYAEASLDRNPIHVDEATAKAAGLPGIILHGLCSMAMGGREIVNRACDGDARRLKRIKVRFSKIVLPGDTLTTRAWLVEKNENITTLGFETVNQRGENVITRALAEIAD